VKLVGRDVLITKDKQLNKALAAWATVVEETAWKHLADVRKTYKTADPVKGRVVFDIRNNRFRLITRINYAMSVVAVEYVLTHAEYLRWSAK
jgi:mRNA interferase HigB